MSKPSVGRAIWAGCALLAGFGSQLLSCASPVIQTLVFVDAEAATRSETTALRIRVDSQDGMIRANQKAPIGDEEMEVQFPTRVPVSAQGADPTRQFIIRVWAMRGIGESESAFNETAARVGFVPDGAHSVDLVLTDDCLNVQCTDPAACLNGACPEETCVQGSCVPIPTLEPAD